MRESEVDRSLLPLLLSWIFSSCSRAVYGTQGGALQAQERPLACPHGSPHRPLSYVYGTADNVDLILHNAPWRVSMVLHSALWPISMVILTVTPQRLLLQHLEPHLQTKASASL